MERPAVELPFGPGRQRHRVGTQLIPPLIHAAGQRGQGPGQFFRQHFGRRAGSGRIFRRRCLRASMRPRGSVRRAAIPSLVMSAMLSSRSSTAVRREAADRASTEIEIPVRGVHCAVCAVAVDPRNTTAVASADSCSCRTRPPRPAQPHVVLVHDPHDELPTQPVVIAEHRHAAAFFSLMPDGRSVSNRGSQNLIVVPRQARERRQIAPTPEPGAADLHGQAGAYGCRPGALLSSSAQRGSTSLGETA